MVYNAWYVQTLAKNIILSVSDALWTSWFVGASFSVSDTVSTTATSAFCNDIVYLCVTLSAGTGATYTDADPSDSSNVMCIDISGRLICAPSKAVNLFFHKVSVTNTFTFISHFWDVNIFLKSTTQQMNVY